MESPLSCSCCYNYTSIGGQTRGGFLITKKRMVLPGSSPMQVAPLWGNQRIRPGLATNAADTGATLCTAQAGKHHHRERDLIPDATPRHHVPNQQTISHHPRASMTAHPTISSSSASLGNSVFLWQASLSHFGAFKALICFLLQEPHPYRAYGFWTRTGSLLGQKTFPFVSYFWSLIIFSYDMPRALRTLGCGRWLSSHFILTNKKYDINHVCTFSKEDRLKPLSHHGLWNRITSGVRAF